MILMELISTKICKTSDIGINDNLFGGTMLSWMDEAGGVFAAHNCCTANMITLRINEVVFKKPVKVKEHIRMYGKTLAIGKSSITIYIEARRILFTGEAEEVVCSTEMQFVRINEQGESVPIDECARQKLIKQINN
jgi:acyl-CoA thioesterase YciA